MKSRISLAGCAAAWASSSGVEEGIEMIESSERTGPAKHAKPLKRARRSAGLKPLHRQVIGFLGRSEKPLQTAEIRRLAHLSTIQARDACEWLFEAGFISRRIRVVPVTVRARVIRQRRAFWTLAEKGKELLAGDSLQRSQ
jgi:hypothetical protein